MKRVLILLFSTMLAGQVWANVIFDIDNLTYYEIRTNCVSVAQRPTNNPENIPTGDLIIPSKVKYNKVEYTVTGIKESAFAGCSGLTSVVVPNTVTTIGDAAFSGCSALQSITLPFVGNKPNDSHQYPLGYIFGTSGYTGAKETDQCYYDDNGDIHSKTYRIPASLKSVTITGSSYIPDYAFERCTGLTSVSIPNTITIVGSWAFEYCNSLQYNEYDNACYIGNSDNPYLLLIKAKSTDITSCEINSNCKFIYRNAFKNCSGLTSMVVPNSVITIGYAAFGGCWALQSITLPFVGDKPHSAGDTYQYPFGYIFFGSDIYTLETKTYQEYYGSSTSSTTTDYYYIPKSLKSVTITGCSYIPYGAFYGCNSLSVVIPDCVTSIGPKAFYDVNTILYTGSATGRPWGAKNIGVVSDDDGFIYADAGKTQLVGYTGSTPNITIPNSVTSIGRCAFRNYSGLTSVTIQDGVTSIGVSAFYNVNTIVYTGSATGRPWGARNIGVVSDDDGFIYADAGKTQLVGYTGSTPNITIPNSVTGIASYAFSNCTGLTEINIPGNVTSIGKFAFSGCSSLTKITLPFVGDKPHSADDTYQYPFGYIFGTDEYTGGTKTLQYYYGNSTSSTTYNYYYIPTSLEEVIITGSSHIPYGAFYSCSSLTSVTISGSIGNNAFYGCDGITSITIHNSVTNIGAGAFNKCKGLTSISIPNSVTNIGSGAFSDCDKLTSITIPESVASIGNDAFSGCGDFTSITTDCEIIGSANLYLAKDGIRYKVFNKESVEVAQDSYSGKIVLPASVTAGNTFIVARIGQSAFSNCGGLTSIIIPNSVTSIGRAAFNNCWELTSISIPNSVTSIDAAAFSGCNRLVSITIPESVVSFSSSLGKITSRTLNLYFQSSTAPSDWEYGYNMGSYSDPLHIYMNCKVINVAVDEEFGNVLATGYEVKAVDGSLWYLNNAQVTLTATAQNGYHVKWDDGNTENVRKFSATESKTYTATFETYSEVVDAAVAATCTATGLTEGKHCATCGGITVSQKIIPAKGHTRVTDAAVAQTCTETGLTEGKHCSVCGEVIVAQEVIPANGHTEVTDAAIAPTCTETGLSEGKHCSVCNTVLVTQNTIPALGHTEVVDNAIEPTCTATGLTDGKHCSVCGVVTKAQEIVPANGHTDVVDAAVTATCTVTGLTEGKHCSVCGVVTVAQNVVPASHTEIIDAAVAATCTATGLTEGKHCSVCGEVLVAQTETPMTAHTIVTDAAVAATATKTGLTAGSHCSVCGAVIVAQKVVPALDEQGGENGGNNNGNQNGGQNGNEGGENNNPPTAVSETATNAINIYTNGNTIVIENATDEIRVYDAMGALVGRDSTHCVRAEIRVNGAGVYIVKVGNVAKRVMVN